MTWHKDWIKKLLLLSINVLAIWLPPNTDSIKHMYDVTQGVSGINLPCIKCQQKFENSCAYFASIKR